MPSKNRKPITKINRNLHLCGPLTLSSINSKHTCSLKNYLIKNILYIFNQIIKSLSCLLYRETSVAILLEDKMMTKMRYCLTQRETIYEPFLFQLRWKGMYCMHCRHFFWHLSIALNLPGNQKHFMLINIV